MKLVQILFLALILATNAEDVSFTTLKDLKLNIVVHYSPNEDKPVEGFGLRGNGLGLCWDSSQSMDQVDSETWNFTITYQQTAQGFGLQEEDASILSHGDKLKVSVYMRDGSGNEIAMKNRITSIKLPLSRTSSFFTPEYVPQIDIYPFFHFEKGIIENFPIEPETDETEIGLRNIVVYKPPGLLENPQPSYKWAILIDFDPLTAPFFEPALNEMFASGQHQQTVLIGVGDWKPGKDRLNQLSPIEGDSFDCKEGNLTNACNGCVQDMDELLYWLTEGGCGITVTHGGHSEAFLSFLMNEVASTVDQSLFEGHVTTLGHRRRDRGIVGMSMGGLFSCNSAWAHPELFSWAGCSSSSFWWPMKYTPGTNITQERYLYNTIMNSSFVTNKEPRYPQKFYIDVAQEELEDLDDVLGATVDVMRSLTKVRSYRESKNVWLEVIPGQSHSIIDFIARLGNVFGYLSRD